MRLEFEVIVEGEMPENDFDLLVDDIRHATGEIGQLAAVGRSFTWHTLPERRDIHVSVLSRDGKTVIRVSESLKRITGGLFGGMVGGGGMGTAGIWIGVAMRMHHPWLIVPLWGGAITVAYLTARGVLESKVRERHAELHALAETIGAQARDSIAAARRTLPRR